MTADEKPPARISHRIFTTSYLEMRIEMIKLVASDLDGTLLLNGAQSVEDSMFEGFWTEEFYLRRQVEDR